MTIKIAFDVHGVLDTYPYFRELANMLYSRKDTKVYIISGQLYDEEMQSFLAGHNIRFYRYLSIAQYLIDTYPYKIDWIGNKPYIDDEIWNKAKSILCDRYNIDYMYDDSTEYSKYFENIKTTYIQVHNGIWRDSGRATIK